MARKRRSEVKDEVMEQVVRAFDAADADLIEASLKGAVVAERLVYQIKVGGQIVTGLSIVGVKEVVRWFNENKGLGLRINDDLKWEVRTLNGEEYFIAIVSAVDNTGQRWYGAAMQPLMIKTRDGRSLLDPFALPKAISKAQRNALRALLPEPLIQELINRWVGEGKVVELPAIPEELRDVIDAETGEVLSEPIKEVEGEKVEAEKVEIEDETELWREAYRIGRRLWGDAFKEQLRALVKERYDADRLTLPTDQLSDLVAYLRTLTQ